MKLVPSLPVGVSEEGGFPGQIGMHQFVELRDRYVVQVGGFSSEVHRMFRGQRNVLADLVFG